MLRLAMIGCGKRLADLMCRLTELDRDVRLTAVADPDESGARARLAGHQVPVEDCHFYADARSMLDHADAYDGILIGTRCHLHADMAVQAAATGLPIFLEKPVGLTYDQLDALARAFHGMEHRVLVSFPLRFSPLFQRVNEIVSSGRLGTINQVQAINNIPYGGVYFGTWYRSATETGGLWLQKATHDVDCIHALVQSEPSRVAAISTQRVFTGDKPYGLHCAQCPDTDICPESPKHMHRRRDTGGMADWNEDPARMDHACVFSSAIQHHDAGSALIQYANGVHASYSQNFVTRRSAARRGAILTGYLATLEFDFPKGRIRIVDHHADTVEHITIDTGERAHFGGDRPLLAHFLNMIRDHARALLPLTDGLRSAATCIAITQSDQDGTFHEVRPIRTDSSQHKTTYQEVV